MSGYLLALQERRNSYRKVSETFLTKRLRPVKDELKDRLDAAWGRYVRRQLDRDPSLNAKDILEKDVAAEVARLVGRPFSASTFSKIRKGTQQPYADQLMAIAEVLGEDYKNLVGLRGKARDIRGGKGGSSGANEKGA